MMTSHLVQAKSPILFKKTLRHILPSKIWGQLMFWGAIPVILLFLTVGIGFLNSSVFSIYLPIFALIGGGICLRWRTVGLGICYLALTSFLVCFYSAIASESHLNEMGLIFTLALDYFILLLCLEEGEQIFNQLLKKEESQASKCMQLQLELEQSGKKWKDLQQQLENEVEVLKEQAEQRVLEKQAQDRQMELIHSEIEWLTEGKRRFVAEAKKGQSLQKELILSQEHLLRLQTEPAAQYKQLRSQFDEKKEILYQTREALFHKEEALLAIEKELSLTTTNPEYQGAYFYESALNTSIELIEGLEREIIHLEELVSHTLTR